MKILEFYSFCRDLAVELLLSLYPTVEQSDSIKEQSQIFQKAKLLQKVLFYL